MEVIEIFPDLWKRVYKRHMESGITAGCHDVFHAARVAKCASEIAENEYTAKLASVAGFCHNADRILQHDLKVGRKNVPETMVVLLINEWLHFVENLSVKERLIIVDAVLKHSFANDPNDSPTLMTLKDADRLVNLEPDAIMRSSQFFLDFPVVDPVHWLSDPNSTFVDPGSVIKSLSNNIKWADFDNLKFGIRLPKAKTLAGQRAAYLLDYIEQVKKCWAKTGLLPFIPPE